MRRDPAIQPDTRRVWRSSLLGAVVAFAVVPALVLTVLRITTPDVGIAVRLVSFTPYAVLAYALVLLLLVVVLVRRRLRRGPEGWAERRVPAGVAVLAAAGLVLHCSWLAPLAVGEPAPPTGEGVTVMSANMLQGRGDPAALAREAATTQADVLVVSEVTRPLLDDLLAAGIEDALPYRVGRPDSFVQGTMVFSRERIEVLDRPATFSDTLVVRTAGLSLVAAHPAPPTLPEVWRRDHATVLGAARRHGVDLVVGDLNATLDHEPVQAMVAAGWRDSVELSGGGFAPTWPAHGEFFPFFWPVVQIDHVMVREPWQVVDTSSVDVPDTDHLAVVATLTASPAR